jgi:hypothetical protein
MKPIEIILSVVGGLAISVLVPLLSRYMARLVSKSNSPEAPVRDAKVPHSSPVIDPNVAERLRYDTAFQGLVANYEQSTNKDEKDSIMASILEYIDAHQERSIS